MLASYLMILHSTLFVLLFTVLFPISHVFLRYFHLSTFFWMFLEGKYMIFILLVHFTKLTNWFLFQACICSSRFRCLLHWQTSSTSTVFSLAGVGNWSTVTVLIFQKMRLSGFPLAILTIWCILRFHLNPSNTPGSMGGSSSVEVLELTIYHFQSNALPL